MRLPFLRRPVRTLGAQGEALAARYLRRHGYRILERNIRLAGCELDIVAREGDTIAFVEVKTRRVDNEIPPEASIGYTKRRHIVRAARQYIATHPEPDRYYRFDVVTVVIPEHGKAEITLLRNAFRDE